MRIDTHGHVSSPSALYVHRSNLLADRGALGRHRPKMSDDQIRAAMTEPVAGFGNLSHIEHLDNAGIDVQLISPRPYTLMHSERPAKVVRWYAEEANEVVLRVCQLFPDRFRPIASIPQSPDLSPEEWAADLRHSINDLGFIGCLVNPDPHEGLTAPPAMDDRYWYPLYEALCELDVPAMLHSAGCRPPAREPYNMHFISEETVAIISLLRSSVFDDFPTLKLVVPHGGGAVPYQIGRLSSSESRNNAGARFADKLSRLWYDTCLYSTAAIRMLIDTVGAQRCLFGSEKPGTGTARDPDTGRWYDDVHLMIEDLHELTDADREMVFCTNAQALYRL